MGAVGYKLWMGIYYVLLLSTSFLATFIGIVATFIGQRLNTNFYVARTFWHVAGPIIGWKFEVQGEDELRRLEESGKSAVLLGNHQNVVDILFLGRIFPRHAAIMAKKSLRMVPGLGWFMMLSGSVFIDRANNKSAVTSMRLAGEEMKRKKISLFIFPEGTRRLSEENELQPFKKGAFHLAVQSGTPIVPIVCENYSRLLKKNKYFKRGTLKIRVLPPISVEGMTAADVPALIEKTRDQMNAALREISTPPKPASPTPLLDGRKQRTYSATAETRPVVDVEGDGDEDLVEAAVGDAKAAKGDDDTATTVVETASTSSTVEPPRTSIDTDATVVKDGDDGKLAIAMVSDFFHPVVGGVEGHIYSLSVELTRRGHRVIIITHHHGDRRGIRYLAPGIKVYHVPFVTLASSASLPNYLSFLPYFRAIVLRERIQLVHGHGTLSSLAHEAIHHAPLFGIRSCFTDHSLFPFSEAVGVLTNKLLASALRNADAVICVSNTGRENTALRAEIEPERVSVIPNALVPSQFEPDPSRPDPDYITIVVISRLVYRKGVDLLVASAPTICELFPDVRFVVGGDGPKMVDLLQMREKYELQDRIELVGSVRPADVRGVLTRGQIYLNTSLTEAFGISITEAACAGLFVVATRVGGVPEILPEDMIEFCRADEDDVIRALTHAIHTIRSGSHDPQRAHARMRDMYSWAAVAERTEIVYERVMASRPWDAFERLTRLLALGPIFGPVMCCIIAVQHYFLLVLEFLRPADGIERVPRDWDVAAFGKLVERERAEMGAVDLH